jgi:hypothetical protein
MGALQFLDGHSKKCDPNAWNSIQFGFFRSLISRGEKVMKAMKKYFSVIAVAVLALSFASCGSSDEADAADDGDDATTTDTTEASTELIAQTTMSLVGTTSSLSAGISDVPPSLRYTVSEGDLSDACVSGTFAYEYNDETGVISLIAEQCVDENSTTIDGTISLSSGTLSFDSFTVASDGVTSTIDGDVVITEGDDSISVVFDLSGSIDDDTFVTEGTLTFDSTTNLVTGELAFTVNSVGVTCTFTDFDVTTATEEDFADACSLD